MVFGMVHPNGTVVVLLWRQWVPVSDCWHVILIKHLSLSSVISTLLQILCTLLWAS